MERKAGGEICVFLTCGVHHTTYFSQYAEDFILKTEASLNEDDIDVDGNNVLGKKAYRHYIFENHGHLSKYNRIELPQFF